MKIQEIRIEEMKRELEEKEQNLMMDKVQEGLKEVGTEREVYIIIKL